jgi:hypothetical protein
MKSFLIAAFSAAMLAPLGLSSGAEAAIINFSAAAFDGAPTYTGASLDQSDSLNLDGTTLLVGDTGPGDASGLSQFDPIAIIPPNIVYGFGTGPGVLPGSGIDKIWVGDTGDKFTETLTTIDSINRMTPDAITIKLSGTVSDTAGIFVDVPIFLILSATQVGGAGSALTITFTDTTEVGGVPEASTWAMMALGFAALGYAAFRGRHAGSALRSA